MTIIQKTIAVLTIAFVAIFFHRLFCHWETGEYHRILTRQNAGRMPDESGLVMSLGPFAGIYARSLSTHAVDAVLGVAFPITLLGLGLFLLAGPRAKELIPKQPQ